MGKNKMQTVAIIGGGPSGLFMLKSLLENGKRERQISIFEKKKKLGAGMPYSVEGANREHITNVSANEIPELVTTVNDWLQTIPDIVLSSYGISKNHFNEFKVLPRLLFGEYLEAQFELLLMAAERAGIIVNTFLEAEVIDIRDFPQENYVGIYLHPDQFFTFDSVVICTGHAWPKEHEGRIEGYFDSPYPPSKLEFLADHAVAIRGSSLTAIDAIRTLARHNGSFFENEQGIISFQKAESSPHFKIVMHSRSGMLPAIRFHLDDPHLKNTSLLGEAEIKKHIQENDGFLSLDFVFENNFKKILLEYDPVTYAEIAEMRLEEFTEKMMNFRENETPFELFEKEFGTAQRSIEKEESIYWKELLAVLSFALNYPAKYLSAEDMIRLNKALMPLISTVIAFVPQVSAVELLALHRSGVLDIVSVGDESQVGVSDEGHIYYQYVDNESIQRNFYKTYIDCVGQPHLSYSDFPFKGLLEETLSRASLQFKDQKKAIVTKESGNDDVVKKGSNYYLIVPGIAINDTFQAVGKDSRPNERIYIMAVPYISGYNPDYSGLDFCEEASGRIGREILKS
jgi:hypothetical protein